MTAQPKLTELASDIVGLTKAPDLSRRNFFMTASAAAAASATAAANHVDGRRRELVGELPPADRRSGPPPCKRSCGGWRSCRDRIHDAGLNGG